MERGDQAQLCAADGLQQYMCVFGALWLFCHLILLTTLLALGISMD